MPGGQSLWATPPASWSCRPSEAGSPALDHMDIPGGKKLMHAIESVNIL